MGSIGKHTFLVAPGTWASYIIKNFDKSCLKGASLPQDSDAGEMDEEKLKNGEFGIIFEMSILDAVRRLRRRTGGHPPYHLVQFRYRT